MKSFKHMFILFLIICWIPCGRLHAQSNVFSNKETQKNTMEPSVSFSFYRDDLQMALDMISAEYGINIMYANYVQGIATCDLEDVRLSKALEMLLAGTPYRFSKRDGYYVITESTFSEREVNISGDIGIANVKMEGLPGEVFTDENGHYKASVGAGFSGTIQPVKKGYKFNPSFIIYNNLNSDRKRQDYKAGIISSDKSLQKEEKEPLISNEMFDYQLSMALDDLSRQTGVNILYENTVSGLVTCHVDNAPLSKAIEIILSPTNYLVKKMDGYYLVTSPRLDDIKNQIESEKKVMIGNIEMSLESLVRLPCNITPEPDGSYSITIPSGFTGKILPGNEDGQFQIKDVSSDAPFDFANQDYSIKIEGIDEPIITYDFFDDDLCVVLDLLAKETGINIMYTDMVVGLVTCKLNEIPLSKALEIILAATPYNAKKIDNYYLVYSHRFPIEKISLEKEDDNEELKVSQEFIGDDLLMVLEQLSSDSGINIMYSDDVQGVVTCKFEDISLSKALEIVLAPTRYIAKKRDGYYVVTEYLAQNKQYEISGNVGIANVKMKGLPGEVYTDENGYYQAKVEPGFSGRVKPVKDGYNFNPSYIVYNNLNSSRKKQNYESDIAFSNQAQNRKRASLKISEYFMQDDIWTVFDILKGQTGTNILVDDNIHGFVSCHLNEVTLDKALEIIFSATPYIIKKMDSYYLIISPGLDDIKNRSTSNSNKKSRNDNIIRDNKFSEIINHVQKESLLNSPGNQISIESENLANLNNKSQNRMITISDTLEVSGKAFSGVNIIANPGDIKTVTDSHGYYSIEVPYGWSGKITLSKPGFRFEPESKSFKNLTKDLINGKHVSHAD